MVFQPNTIRLKAMCLIKDGYRVLLGKGYDKVKNENFYRVLGGSIDFGETSEQGVRREIQEELNCEIDNLKPLKVIENVFTYEKMSGHEVVFMFSGEAKNKELQKRNPIHIIEKSYSFDAYWINISDIINHKVILYPSCDYKELL